MRKSLAGTSGGGVWLRRCLTLTGPVGRSFSQLKDTRPTGPLELALPRLNDDSAHLFPGETLMSPTSRTPAS
jgi:hypothetical protein